MRLVEEPTLTTLAFQRLRFLCWECTHVLNIICMILRQHTSIKLSWAKDYDSKARTACYNLYCWYNWHYTQPKTLFEYFLTQAQMSLWLWDKVKDSFEYSLIQAWMSLWLRDQPCQKALSLSCLVIPNLWGPSQVSLKLKKLSQCKT